MEVANWFKSRSADSLQSHDANWARTWAWTYGLTQNRAQQLPEDPGSRAKVILLSNPTLTTATNPGWPLGSPPHSSFGRANLLFGL